MMEITRICKMRKIGSFVLNTAVSFFVWNTAYILFLFQNLPTKDKVGSWTWYFCFATLGTTLLLAVFWNRRNRWIPTVLIHVLPLGVYTVLAYRQDYAPLIVGALISAVILSVVVAVYIFKRPMLETADQVEIAFARISKTVYRIASVFAVALIVVMLVIGVNNQRFIKAVANSYMNASVVTGRVESEYSFDTNKDIFLKLEPSAWMELSVEEKIETLQTVVDIESHSYLGILAPITVVAEDLEYDEQGSYSADEQVIRIDLDHLREDHVGCVTETVFRELFEAYTLQTVGKGCQEYVESRTETYLYNAAWYTADAKGTPLGG